MRRRIYVDGKPAWSANEEGGYARRQGFGGSAIGHFQGIVLTHAQRKAKATEDERRSHHRRKGREA